MVFHGSPNLETERLLLRKINSEDYAIAFDLWCNDSKQVKYTVHGIHKNVDVTKRVYARWIEEYDDEKTR